MKKNWLCSQIIHRISFGKRNVSFGKRITFSKTTVITVSCKTPKRILEKTGSREDRRRKYDKKQGIYIVSSVSLKRSYRTTTKGRTVASQGSLADTAPWPVTKVISSSRKILQHHVLPRKRPREAWQTCCETLAKSTKLKPNYEKTWHRFKLRDFLKS